MREFISVVIGRTDKRTRAFEGVLVGTLRNISSWLVQAASLSSSSGSGIHPSIPRLFTVSHLPGVMYAFLSHTLGAERDWVVHSEVYVALMDMVKHLSSSSVAGVVKEPVRRVEESCGVQAWMWDWGEVVWVREGEADGQEGRSLGDAVKRLERHWQGLERYGNRFKFAAMAEKIEMLCEGISYLLFQQLVGG
ncbi:uncharacterized protein LACBIDRAFT_297430 [Laccaria bicolor S238N-H82]|uniref:Predicted protein n=1 Tax=Laccaria bicolor (strain S238N-H82 / ATCC MYA-4686) TaxID=486041 RepID=B0E392_LACBS|nr:uncharacterized protein LACBIDRAFT_297430 [Laccaria bicolor S238N-H82]EDQ98687.1 predicted protein [Laccaria bicolor S238N-H82]|eukprot:XP_001890661.1 predicted protein [Laccaria bicolor S238N-H82]